MPAPSKNKAGETTWSEVKSTKFAAGVGVGVAEGVAVATGVLEASGLVTATVFEHLEVYLEKIKKPKVPIMRIKMAPKMAMAFLFILFLYQEI